MGESEVVSLERMEDSIGFFVLVEEEVEEVEAAGEDIMEMCLEMEEEMCCGGGASVEGRGGAFDVVEAGFLLGTI